MTDQWATYLCNVNGELASILLNTALIDDQPSRAKSQLLWVWVYLVDPRGDGLTNDVEAALLYKIEDKLASALTYSCSAVLGGRITTLGRREFYFYGVHGKSFEESVRKVMLEYPEYRFALDQQRDPQWRQYLDVLYPSPEQFQSISNQDVLESLKKNGDDHSIVRKVQHWAFFPTDDQRQGFLNTVLTEGFTLDSEFSAKSDNPFAICLHKDQSVVPERIDESTLLLFRLCEKWGGTYDGWETFATNGR